MSTFPSDQDFSRHTENLSAVMAALVQLERAHKQAIRAGDEPAVRAMRKIHTLLIGVYAESRLRKILADPLGFNHRERELIWLKSSQLDRWLAVVDFSARRHYGVLAHQDLNEVLAVDVLAQIQEVNKVLKDDLAPVITDRNKLAHGQWIWQLASRKEDKFTAQQSSYDYNYSELRARFQLLDLIGRLVNVLCVSQPTFARDFTKLISQIAEARKRLNGGEYDALVSQLQRLREAGAAKRAAQSN